MKSKLQKLQKVISPPKSGKSKRISRGGIQHKRGDFQKWTEANLSGCQPIIEC